MNTVLLEARAAKVRFDKNSVWVSLQDGRQSSIPLSYFPRLLKATPKQRRKYE